MNVLPIPLWLETDFAIKVGPVKFADAASKGVPTVRPGLDVTARVTAADDDDDAIAPVLEVGCPDITGGKYLVRIEGSVLTVADFGALIGEKRYLVVSDAAKNFRVFYELLISHPRRAELVT